jgi:hypothetical protein
MSIHPLHPKEDAPHMTGTTWQHRLDCARSAGEIVNVSRDFLATFAPMELHALPTPCWPPARIAEGSDISSYAFELVRHECNTPGALELVHRLARFFSHASMRLAQVSALQQAEDDEQRQSA